MFISIKKVFVSIAFIAIFGICTAFSQNRYLSFTEGYKTGVKSELTTPQRDIKGAKSNDLVISYSFNGAFVAEESVKSQMYNFLHIKDFSKMTQVGAPALPAHNDIIAMPRGAQGKIEIINLEYKEFSGFMIHPALKPARDTEGAPSPLFEKDMDVYSKDEFFPRSVVEIINVKYNRGTGLATTQIRPVQFNPVTGIIRVYSKIEYKITTEGGEKSFDYIATENSQQFINLLKRSVLNSESIPDKFSSENQKKK